MLVSSAAVTDTTPTPTGMTPGPGHGDRYQFKAGDFEGPLDLLLHLVRVNEVEIADIPIVEITRQYHDYLEMMRELNLEIAGEYIVMAATLMQIKSQMLLPKEPSLDEEEADPRAELAQQLMEYQRFKQAAENLQAMDSVRGLIWTRDDTVPDEFTGEELLAVDMFQLLSAFRVLLGRLGDEAHLRLHREQVSVVDKIRWLTELLERRRTVTLTECLESFTDRLEQIALFLAMLEMMRLHLLVAFQRKLLDEIRLALRPEPPAEPAAHSTPESTPEHGSLA
jgi:segregation and condensation protein A